MLKKERLHDDNSRPPRLVVKPPDTSSPGKCPINEDVVYIFKSKCHTVSETLLGPIFSCGSYFYKSRFFVQILYIRVKRGFYRALFVKLWTLLSKSVKYHILMYRPRNTNSFQVQVNVEALGEVKFELVYRELLKRTKGYYNHIIYLNPGQLVEDFLITVMITESRTVTYVKIPPLQKGLLAEGPLGKSNDG